MDEGGTLLPHPFFPPPSSLVALLVCLVSGVLCLWSQASAWAVQPTVRTLDRNGDGRPDLWVHLAPRQVVMLEVDRDYDGTADIQIDYDHNHPARLTLDRDHDGRPELIGHFAGRRISRAEVDRDGNGQLEMQVFYNATGYRQRLERDSNGDGRPDEWVYFAEMGAPMGRQVDKDFDGVPDETYGVVPEGSSSASP